MHYRNNVSTIIRIVAGGYLAYLGVRLMRDGVLTGNMVGGQRLLGIICSIVFIGFGGFIAIHALLFGFKSSEQNEEASEEQIEDIEAEQEPDADAAEEAPAAPTSLFARANMASGVEEDEEEAGEEEE